MKFIHNSVHLSLFFLKNKTTHWFCRTVMHNLQQLNNDWCDSMQLADNTQWLRKQFPHTASPRILNSLV